MISRSACLLLMLLTFLSGSVAQVPVPYSMFLDQPVPQNGAEVLFNFPVLRWPYQKGEQVRYEVRLSQDSLFKSKGTLEASNLAGAIFLPYRPLKEGRWFWQYRVSGKEWSRLQSFSISEKAIPFHAPAPEKLLAGIPLSHPRILKENPQQDLRGFAEKPEAKAIIAQAEKSLTTDLVQEPGDDGEGPANLTELQKERRIKDAIVRKGHQIHDAVVVLCQAYLLTGNPQYKTKALQAALAVSKWDPDGPSAQVDFTDGACMLVMALVLDTFYDNLNPEQQKSLRDGASYRAERFYQQWVNNIESKVLSGHVWQLLLNEFFKTGLALFHHNPRAANWLTYAYELFMGRTPVLAGPSGGWAEGASYFTMNMDMLVEIPDKIKTYTGFDFFNSHPWYRNTADWLIYQVPPGSAPDGFGDNTEELRQPPKAYAAYAKAMENLLHDARFTWYYQKIEELQQPNLAEEPVLRWFRLLRCDDSALSTEGLKFSMVKVFQEAGIASMHTHVADPQNNIFVSMRASPFGAYGHAHADQNTFNVILDGERLFFRTGYKVAMNDPHRIGWSMHTKGHNGILINGEGQPYSVDAGGQFQTFYQHAEMAYLMGDASNAYRSKQKKWDAGLTRFYRRMALLKPGVLVIYDELEAAQPSEWTWLIHSLENMTVDTTTAMFISTVDTGKGAGKLWSSMPVTWTLTNKFEVPAVSYRSRNGKVYKDDQWHLSAKTQGKDRRARFLSVIQITRTGQLAHPLEHRIEENGRIVVQVGEWEIEAVLDTNDEADLKVHSNDRNVFFSSRSVEVK